MMSPITTTMSAKQVKLVGSWCALGLYLGTEHTTPSAASVFTRIQRNNPEADT